MKKTLTKLISALIISSFVNFAGAQQGEIKNSPKKPLNSADNRKELRANTTDENGNRVIEKKSAKMKDDNRRALLKPLKPGEQKEMKIREKLTEPSPEQIPAQPN